MNTHSWFAGFVYAPRPYMPGGTTSPRSISPDSRCFSAKLPGVSTPEPAAFEIGSPPGPRST